MVRRGFLPGELSFTPVPPGEAYRPSYLPLKNFKLALRRLAFICLLVLAGLGIGLTGGVPLPTSDKRSQVPEIKIELVQQKKETEKAEDEIEIE